jgi:lysozyme
MRTSAAGVALIKRFEGLRTMAYRDSAGVWTIGYGHTAAAGHPPVHAGMTITVKEAGEILARDLATFERQVNTLVKVPLVQAQFDVLASFQFNTGALGRSTLLKRLNAGDYAAVPHELRRWVNAKGKRLSGLVNRREAEAALWTSVLAPTPPATGFWVWLKSFFVRG